MIGFLTKILAGPLVNAVTDVFKSFQNRKVSEAEIRAKVNEAILTTFSTVASSQADVIKTELTGESWLQRNWRPIVAITFAFIIVFYGLITPILVGWFGAPPLRVGDQLLGWIMDACIICLGGYIGGRSLEKIVATLRQ